MKQIVFTLAIFFITLTAWSQAVNDECSNRITIAVTTGGANSYSIDTSTATETLDASCENSFNDNLDVWYEFTMPVNGNVRITNIPSTVSRALFASCGGAELACGTNDGFFYSLTASTTYVLRIAEISTFAGNVNFSIEAFETPTNDECANRTPISVVTGGVSNYSFDPRTATESMDVSCENSFNDNLDVWYEFTMPVNGNIRVTNIPSTVSYSLFSSCGGSELACGTNDGFAYNLTASTIYILRMAENATFAGAITFGIEAFETAGNDTCANRTNITVATGSANSYTFDPRSATESMDASCENSFNDNLDVWYEFTMPVNGNVRITGIASTVSRSIFDVCGGTELACGTNDGFFYSLTASTNYVLRMAEQSGFAGSVTFDIEAFENPVHDECANRIPISVVTGSATSYTFDSRTATESMDASCENSFNDNLDAWYEFTMPVNGNVRITGVPSTASRVLFDSCGGTELACGTDNGFFYSLTASTTYVLRMAEQSGFAGVINFDIEAFEAAPNDVCNNASSLSVGVVAPTLVSADVRAATESMDASCENATSVNMDLWYAFAMPVTGDIVITANASTTSMSFFDSCGGTELACFTGNSTVFGLMGGTTYYLRVARNATFAQVEDFYIQAIPSPLPSCTTTTQWTGASWNNGTPSLSVNAEILSHYDTTTHGSFSACTLSVGSGATLFVRGGDYVEVAYNVNVIGTLDINHEGSLVQRDDAAVAVNNGTIRVRKTTPFLKPRDLMLMGSPMDAETRTGVYNSAFLVLYHTTANFVPHPDVASQFPLAENFADDNGDNWTQYAAGPMNVGDGYIVRPQASYTDGNSTYDLLYTQGTLNNGVVTVPILFNTAQNDSPNILGNPYASAISADDFINANPQVDALYFWEHLTPPSPSLPGYNSINFSMEDISMYNLMGGVAAASDPSGTNTVPNGYIASAQGFAIKANGAGTATFDNSMRRLRNNNTWRTPETNSSGGVIPEKTRLWLEVRNAEYELQSTTLIGFKEGASEAIDMGYDSNRLASAVSLFSIAANGEELGIQTREPFRGDIKIPIGFSTMIDTKTDYTISLQDVEGALLMASDIYLYDHYLKTTTLLNQSSYTFSSEKESYLDRFMLLFGDSHRLGSQESLKKNITWFPNPANEKITLVNPMGLQMNDVVLLDMLGREVASYVINNAQTAVEVDLWDIAKGVYLLQISTDHGTLTEPLLKK